MFTEIMAAAGVLALLTVVPGPDMAVVTERAVGAGWHDGLRTVGGITAGLLVWGVLTVAGLAAVLAASATAYTVVKLLGAGYLLFLGAQALWQSRRGGRPAAAAPDATTPRGNPWRTGLVSNVLNPKIAVFYTGLLPTLAPHSLPSHLGMALLAVLHAALTLVWLGGYVMVLATARAFFERPTVRRVLDRVTGVVLIGFGLKVATADS
ncbi:MULTISPECIES: LysE family translocator [Streptomyces]|uniref:Threonine transporter RhtB n=1 Tax=Streptomyces venezuelae TaxID=54571 RepID=A0A5P2BPC4_STRVZ|nr:MULTISPECIES: LysE family translocator [Streptomyces]NDZ98238.1 LysE family translocator [Streptomyces sp. SID10116]MYY81587.1 LysE family transporter [Streptomyces sp. SID335]MYZ14615.1 LysE family transporter [Streptomyces sp. SID337]NDZ88970.1 LysE family translocator [Streptomyces sp. SID10115]NEB46931.1 LysE family translocator [Streptomyces sp. SID339]